MIRFFFNIGCSESKVIFKGGGKKTNKQIKRKEQTFARRTFHSFSVKTLSDKQTQYTHRTARLKPAIGDAQKLAQNSFPA